MPLGRTSPDAKTRSDEAARSARAARSYWRQSLSRLAADRVGITFGLLLGLLALIALAAPLISEHVTRQLPDEQDLLKTFAPPSAQHWLGTDELGRDTLTRLVWGARVSLGVGFLAVAVFLAIGGTVGVIAGFYGGLVDNMFMRFVDMLMAIPTIYLLILFTSVLPVSFGAFTIQRDAVSLSIVIALTVWGRVARLVRAEVLSIRAREFIVAARAVGATNVRLMVSHIVPNIVSVLIVTATLGVGQIILTEAALDFIGLGVQPPTPSWGNMLLAAQTYFFHQVVLVIAPGLLIVFAVLSANVFGNALRDALDPNLR